jgi:hypothetical protein
MRKTRNQEIKDAKWYPKRYDRGKGMVVVVGNAGGGIGRNSGELRDTQSSPEQKKKNARKFGCARITSDTTQQVILVGKTQNSLNS